MLSYTGRTISVSSISVKDYGRTIRGRTISGRTISVKCRKSCHILGV